MGIALPSPRVGSTNASARPYSARSPTLDTSCKTDTTPISVMVRVRMQVKVKMAFGHGPWA